MDHLERFGLLVAAAVGAFVLVATLQRIHEGRCGAGGPKGGLECSAPAVKADQ